jgi:hypothetical protein
MGRSGRTARCIEYDVTTAVQDPLLIITHT